MPSNLRMKACILAFFLFCYSMPASGCSQKDNVIAASTFSTDTVFPLITPSTKKVPVTRGHPPSASRWLYQLQNASIDEIASTRFDLITIDYARDGDKDSRYTRSDLQKLQTLGKVVLAYLSIGEAESYRYYFNPEWLEQNSQSGMPTPVPSAPCWLRRTNPDWEGNYKVQYWAEAWQAIILDYLDRIIDSGFDGVYLDIVDAYEYWADEHNKEGFFAPEASTAEWMISFIKRIAYHARVAGGQKQFYIFPQNGEGILAYDSDGSFLSTVSGIGVEDLFYNNFTLLGSDETAFRLSFLDQFISHDKSVLVVDYIDDGSGLNGENGIRIKIFREHTTEKVFSPYIGRQDRELMSINTIRGIQE